MKHVRPLGAASGCGGRRHRRRRLSLRVRRGQGPPARRFGLRRRRGQRRPAAVLRGGRRRRRRPVQPGHGLRLFVQVYHGDAHARSVGIQSAVMGEGKGSPRRGGRGTVGKGGSVVVADQAVS